MKHNIYFERISLQQHHSTK